jgi:hypothetical protein
VDEAAAGGGFGSEIPTAEAGDEGDADAVGGVEGAEGIGLWQDIEERGCLIDGEIERLPAKAGGAGDERAALEEILNARGFERDGGDVLDEFENGHIAGDDGRESDGFCGFTADFHADGVGGAHDMTLQ